MIIIVSYIKKKQSDKKNKNIIQDYAAKFGISNNLPSYLSMSLGAGETDLLSITNAYGMIVNGGKKITPTLIDRVQDRRGVTIFRHDQRKCVFCKGNKSNKLQIPTEAIKDSREQVISSSSAYQMVSMLKGAVDRGTGVIIMATKEVAILYLSAPGAAKFGVPVALSFSVLSAAVPASVSVTVKPTI